MDINNGDIIVCIPGFYGRYHQDNKINTGNFPYGGSGYIEGEMRVAKNDLHGPQEKSGDPQEVFWNFYQGAGVYRKALRLANEEEKEAFKLGITNIKEIQKTVFIISYENLKGETKKKEVEAYFETAAVSSIKDLKKVNYVMSSK